MKSLSYSNKIAMKYGINAAIIASFIWTETKGYNPAFPNRSWTRCGYKRLLAAFPFMRPGAPSYAVRKLVNDGILVRTERNESRFDRTFSYAFTDYGASLMED